MNIEHKIPTGYEGKGGIRAAILAKSVNVHQPELKPIVTFLIDFPRFILPEFNTHKMLEKNGASSRAIPVAKQIERVYDNPVIPIHFGKNQAGMVAETELSGEDLKEAKRLWLRAVDEVTAIAGFLEGCKVHKQVVNRLLEPFSMMRMVVTATEWDNFFWLRLHKDADPHIAELARVMLCAYQRTEEVDLQYTDWHTPFFGKGYWTPNFEKEYGITAQEAINHSMSCCAQTSYRKLDMSEGKAEDIIAKLFNGERCHASPATHQAHPICYDFGVDQPTVTHQSRNGDLWSNNLRGWGQYRTLIPNNNCTDFDFNQTIDTADIKANVDMF